MRTKTFKPGEYSIYPKIKFVIGKIVHVHLFNWDGIKTDHLVYSASDITHLRNVLEVLSTPYWADKMLDWAKQHLPQEVS